MKKFIIYILFLFSLYSVCYAADTIHVSAMSDFSSINPSKNFQAKLLQDSKVDDMFLLKGTVLNCKLIKTTAPKRLKRDSKVYFELISYKDFDGTHKFQNSYQAKYAKTVINKEEIQKMDKGELTEKAALTAGDFVIPGFSYAYNFLDGANKNEENNRFKSGVKNFYENSIFSYANMGEEVEIKTGNEFYLKVEKL